MQNFLTWWSKFNLITRIVFGVVVGMILAYVLPDGLAVITVLGDLFLNALKAVAPFLVFILVTSTIANHKSEGGTNIKAVVLLYMLSTLTATILAVVVSIYFPTMLTFTTDVVEEVATPGGVGEVLKGLLLKLVDNPVNALASANYIGILSLSCVLGFALRRAGDTTKAVMQDLEGAISLIVSWVIAFAPVGIMGIIYATITSSGLESLKAYSRILIIIILTEFFFAFVINPIIVWYNIRRNPYPLVLRCIKESGITAFFTMSSAANIPINMQLCEDLGLNKDTYSVTIPLGATVNMSGSAITLNILALSAAYSIGIEVGLVMSIVVSLVSAVSAAGVAGVAGGAVLLIPVACGALGIPSDIAMQVVGIGLVITVVQDAFTTALNSSTDVLLTATADFAARRKRGEDFVIKASSKK